MNAGVQVVAFLVVERERKKGISGSDKSDLWL